MNRAYVELTESQRQTLIPLFIECSRIGGAVMAQVFTDGIHVVVLPDAVAIKVAQATGAQYEQRGRSGYKAFIRGIERDKTKGSK